MVSRTMGVPVCLYVTLLCLCLAVTTSWAALRQGIRFSGVRKASRVGKVGMVGIVIDLVRKNCHVNCLICYLAHASLFPRHALTPPQLLYKQRILPLEKEYAFDK
jgi:hypothetical protein